MTTTLSSSNSGDSVVGSSAKTSSAAPATMPSVIAQASASSSMMPPRAVLTMRTPRLAKPSISRSSSPTVSAVFGRWMVTKSDSAMSFGERHEVDAHLPAAVGRDEGVVREQAHPERERPLRHELADPPEADDARAPCRSARRPPTGCAPSDHPSSAACACGMLRACASSSASVCSAADSTFDCGAFTTITPRRVAASTSTLSRPMPARPTTTRSARGLQHLGRHLGRRPDDERMRTGDHVEQLGG